MSKLYEIEESRDKKLRNFNIRIKDCIALCNIVDEFEEFAKNLKEFSKGNFGNVKLVRLYNYVKDEDAFVTRDIKRFYQNNENVLEAIHKNTYISNFLLIYFDNRSGKFNQEVTQMYEYIKTNKEDKDKILLVLDKLSKLGFNEIVFSENSVFDGIYEYSKANSHYYYYLDGNLEVIPSIENTKYKSNDANYEIQMSTIPLHSPKITLNNLVFDANSLPHEISYDQTMGKILEIKDKNKESFDVLKDAVYFDSYIENIVPLLDKLDKLIISIHNCSSKSRAQMHIDTAKQNIAELQWILANYEESLVEKELICQDVLTREKEKYKKRYNC